MLERPQGRMFTTFVRETKVIRVQVFQSSRQHLHILHHLSPQLLLFFALFPPFCQTFALPILYAEVEIFVIQTNMYAIRHRLLCWYSNLVTLLSILAKCHFLFKLCIFLQQKFSFSLIIFLSFIEAVFLSNTNLSLKYGYIYIDLICRHVACFETNLMTLWALILQDRSHTEHRSNQIFFFFRDFLHFLNQLTYLRKLIVISL